MQWYRRLIGVCAFALLVWWLPSPSVAQDLGYMARDGWVFDVPETAALGPAPGGYADVVYEAAAYYGISGDWLYNTMMCESGGDPSVVGPNGERGVMQYNPAGMWPEMVWASPAEQIWHAAAQFAAGLSSHWVCA